MAEIALDDVKAVRKVLGGTVNDVILAVCAGALRRWFDERGEVLERSLRLGAAHPDRRVPARGRRPRRRHLVVRAGDQPIASRRTV
jgi:hypothetical protein